MRVASICCIIIFILLPGCFSPKYQRPMLELPEDWVISIKDGSPASSVQWWKRFNDPILNKFIEEALQNNKDILVGLSRVEYLRAQLGIARSNFFPQISGNANMTPMWVDHKKVSEGSPSPYSANFSAAWEIDLWGKIRNAKEAALYQLLATEVAQHGIILSITAETAKAYFLLHSLDLQVEVVKRTIKTREDALTIYTAQYKQGLINKLDYTRAKIELETARTALYKIRISREKAETALAVLLGRSPRFIMECKGYDSASYKVLSIAPVVPQDIPSKLLDHRPDIVQAEYLLKAANANIDVARAAWFPSISLTGLLGVVSPHLDTLLKNPSSTWSYGGNGTVPILDFGRVYYNVEAAEAKEKEALFIYEKTVENAFKDICDALTMQVELVKIVNSLEKTVQNLRVAAGLARIRYENGYSSYLEVLDAERTLFQSELDLAMARSDRLSAIVNVCLALGGTWGDK